MSFLKAFSDVGLLIKWIDWSSISYIFVLSYNIYTHVYIFIYHYIGSLTVIYVYDHISHKPISFPESSISDGIIFYQMALFWVSTNIGDSSPLPNMPRKK